MWTDAYIGLPFQREGRDRAGVDCWGLCRMVYRDRLGIDLPGKLGIYTDTDTQTLRRLSAAMEDEAARWTRVDRPREMDIVLMRRGPLPCHVGLALSGGRMLHVMQGIDSTVEPFTGLRWRHRIVGFYRYAE